MAAPRRQTTAAHIVVELEENEKQETSQTHAPIVAGFVFQFNSKSRSCADVTLWGSGRLVRCWARRWRERSVGFWCPLSREDPRNIRPEAGVTIRGRHVLETELRGGG